MNIIGMTNVGDLMVWSNTAKPSMQDSLTAIGLIPAGAKTTLVDQINGNTLTGQLACYAIGPGSLQNATVLTTDFHVPQRFRRVQLLADLRRSVLWPAFASSFTPDRIQGEVQGMTLTGDITVNLPVNAAGQKLVFIWT